MFLSSHSSRAKALLAVPLAAAVLALAATPAVADVFPSKPVRIVVPYATGGASDALARQLAAALQVLWGKGVVVDNKAGASGNIGSMDVVRAPADGYTLLMQNSTMVINQAVTSKKNYDPLTDLTPIMLLGLTPTAVVASASANVGSVKDLIAAGKASAKGLNYGSCGIGTPQHFIMELLKQKTGLQAEHVSYKGCSPALTDVVAGQIPYAALSANMVVPYVQAGKLRVIGLSSSARYSQLPDVPTFEEQGLKPFDFSVWYALMGPAKMPPDIVQKIRTDVEKLMADPGMRKRLAEIGIEENKGGPEEVVKVITLDQARYQQVAKAAGIKPE